MASIPKKHTKLIVKDDNGKVVQLLPEVEVDMTLNASSSNPVSCGAIAEVLNHAREAAQADAGVIKIMNEEPTTLNTAAYSDETLIAWVQGGVVNDSNAWSITVNTEAVESGGRKTGIPFNLCGQDGIELTVDWGDGTSSTLTSANYPISAEDANDPYSPAKENDEASVHEYAVEGIYTIRIESNDWANTCFFQAYIEETSDYTDTSNGAKYYQRTLISVNNPLPKIKGTILTDRAQTYGFIYDAYYPYSTFTPINDMICCFYGCRSLTSIPEDLFVNNPQATDFGRCFNNCRSLTSIPEDLFASNILAFKFGGCFSGCSSLTSIPEGLFNNCVDAVNFRRCFNGCSSLTSIPAKLFDKTTKVLYFGGCFAYCTSLASIPEGLFNKCTLATSFGPSYDGGCFERCTSLTTIPENLFAMNVAVKYFGRLFEGCTSLASIPEGLFANNTAVTNFSFCFQECTSLTTIPEGLFANNTAVTDFYYCFNKCTSLTTIPSGLFANNTAVSRLRECFINCSSLGNFTIHIGSSLVSDCFNFVDLKENTTRTVYVPSDSTTQTKFNAVASTLGLTIIGE